MTSCPTANGIRWVNPSIATVSPSRMVDSTASARVKKRDMHAFQCAAQAHLRGHISGVKCRKPEAKITGWQADESDLQRADFPRPRRGRRYPSLRPDAV